MKNSTEILPIREEYWNTTNINSIHTINDIKNTINHQLLNSLQKNLKPSYLEQLTVVIIENIEKETEDFIKNSSNN